MKLTILIVVISIRISYQSECLVSEWGTWSKCHGGCQKGLIVRNRDVLQPPLQELTPEGRMMQRLCPHLYETRYCDQKTCGMENQVNYRDSQNHVENPSAKMVEKQMEKVGLGAITDEVGQAAMKKQLISETEQLFKLDDAINRRYGPQPSDNLVNNNTPIIDITTQQMSNKQWRDDMLSSSKKLKSSTSSPTYDDHLQAFGRAGGIKITTEPTTSTTTTPSPPRTTDYYIHHRLQSLNSLSSRKYRPSSDHSVSNLLRKIEQALDTNQPLDEKYIKSALRRNRKLSKILVDAYRQRKNLMNSQAVIQPYPPQPIATTTKAPSFITAESTTLPPRTTKLPTFWNREVFDAATTNIPDFYQLYSTTTSPLLYWPKTGGYVPNTRKHASEITAQLYMTNEIVQTLADDPIPMEINPECEQNKRCCKVIKNTCSDGIDPKFVKRWYRPKGSSVCVPYHYPRCGSMDEMEDLPILFEQNCQDLCFSQQEKRIAPLFTLEAEED